MVMSAPCVCAWFRCAMAVVVGAALHLTCLIAGEATLTLPDPVMRGGEVDATITYAGEGRITGMDLPTVTGITWGQPHSQQSTLSIVNRVRNQSLTVQLPLQIDAAIALGPLAIPAFDLRLDSGELIRVAATPTTVIAVELNQLNQLNGDGGAEVSFDPALVVPGQPTTLQLRVWCRATQDVEPGIGPPSEALALGQRRDSSGTITTDAAGEKTNWFVMTFRWPLAFSTPGSFTVSGQQRILIATGRVDVFGRGEARPHHLPIRPATITVAELPTDGRPTDFAGLIGEVSADVRLDRSQIAAGEGTRLSVTVGGRQLDLVQAPTLAATPGLQIYPRPSENVAGGRIFHWDIVPSGPGSYTFPALSFPWFDPLTRRYRRTVATMPTLTVIPGRNREFTMGGALSNAPGDNAKNPGSTPTDSAIQRSMPLPVGERADQPPAPLWVVAAWISGAIFSAVAVGLLRWRRRPRATHRGAALQQALSTGDPLLISSALAAFATTSVSTPQRALITRLQNELENHRFGGSPLPEDFAVTAAALKDVP